MPIKLMKDIKKNFMVLNNKDYYEISKFDRGNEGIEYCNLGGGFIKRLKFNDAFLKDYGKGKIKFTNSIPTHYIYGKISCEGMDLKYVMGYYNPVIRWNGWINPFFTWETCQQINNACTDENLLFRFYEHKSRRRKPIRTLEYSNQYDCEAPFVIPSQRINGIEVYDCGLGICWELYK